MMKWIKRVLWGLGGLALIAVIAAMIYREPLERLYRVATLFSADRIVSNFSNTKTMFLTDDIPRSGPVYEFGGAPDALPETFEFESEAFTTTELLERTKTTSLIVIRDDQIEYEDYFLGTGPEDQRISWSIAKSFLSALVGIAVDEGAIADLNDPVTKYAPSLAGFAYENASIRQVAMMTSGVAFNEDYIDRFSDINMMGYELGLGGSLDRFSARITDTAGAPGENWRYVSIDTHVLGMALRGATGKTVGAYMAEKLWSKIGVEADAYYNTDGEGAAFVLGGLNMRTRDYARFGRLFLNDGMWEGEQIIPKGWVRESTSDLAPPPAPTYERGEHYGYQWWMPPAHDEEFYGIGVYGQYLWIDRKAGVIVVKTSADKAFRENDGQVQLETIAMMRAIARR
jgi:CubicO group peptidase (beta-lactamase class C family)